MKGSSSQQVLALHDDSQQPKLQEIQNARPPKHGLIAVSKALRQQPHADSISMKGVLKEELLPSQQIPALNDGRQLPKVCNLAALLPTGLNRLDQISQVDLCQLGQAKPVDVPIIYPLAELHEEEDELFERLPMDRHTTRL